MKISPALVLGRPCFGNYLLPALSGLLAAFSLMLPALAGLSLIALAPWLFLLKDETSFKRILHKTLVFSLAFSAVLYAFSLVEFLHYFISVFVFSLFAAFIWAGQRCRLGRYYYLYVPWLFVCFEYIRASTGYIPTHIAVLGNALAPTPWLGLAKIFGYWGLSLFAVYVNAALAWLAGRKKGQKLYWAAFSALLLIAAFSGRLLLGAGTGADGIGVAAVSRFSMPEEQEYLETDRLEFDEAYREYYLQSTQAEILRNIDQAAELVFFPANVFDTVRPQDRDEEAFRLYRIENNGAVIEFFREIALRAGVEVVFGLNTLAEGREYITLLQLDKQGRIKGRYDKTELMIGSEYWPFGDWVPFYWRWLGDFPVDAEITMDPGYTPSQTPYSTLKLDGLTLAPLICSESHDPANFSRAKKSGADAVYATSNNNWYFALKLDYYLNLHLNILRINSVASGLPVIFNGKDNYAGLIYPDGRLEIDRFAGSGEADRRPGFYYWQGRLESGQER